MTFIDGFVVPVPASNKSEFIEHARKIGGVFVELGALHVRECWGADVPDGTLTDFKKAVQAKPDEAIAFGWIEWPDRGTRDAAMEKMQGLMKTDDRVKPETNPMPFDGKRMIFAGFESLLVSEK
ncbi:hypothetical protein A7A08_02622 [Methyloligella halotolerans]|uniref:RNA signal recognition particle n=1 Tax=Methyloligella halotolerans TaxID=1177755 RepID=A0A1E2RWQ3_9HYPH|nr:DUF1428 domain-containing protein [Methyloligella halotolerans]ODA66499.1 hypothetical protein A7A08_02622 [Methyloligella halotolerans]